MKYKFTVTVKDTSVPMWAGVADGTLTFSFEIECDKSFCLQKATNICKRIAGEGAIDDCAKDEGLFIYYPPQEIVRVVFEEID